MLHSITANVTGKTRRQFRGGREYLVAPLTLIVPGVLNGSQGPLYYPADEIERDFMAWNEMPIVVYHPQSVDGSHVSAQSPGVLDKQGIGYVRRPAYNGKLTAEGWFDAERTRTVDQRVYDALLRNEPQELSTGLYTDNEPAENGSTAPDGKLYTHVARNYRPDHLAILPDQIGACSLRDGCGVLVNHTGDTTVPLEEKLSVLQSLAVLLGVENAYNPNQPRDAKGQFGAGGGGGGGATGGKGASKAHGAAKSGAGEIDSLKKKEASLTKEMADLEEQEEYGKAAAIEEGPLRETIAKRKALELDAKSKASEDRAAAETEKASYKGEAGGGSDYESLRADAKKYQAEASKLAAKARKMSDKGEKEEASKLWKESGAASRKGREAADAAKAVAPKKAKSTTLKGDAVQRVSGTDEVPISIAMHKARKDLPSKKTAEVLSSAGIATTQNPYQGSKKMVVADANVRAGHGKESVLASEDIGKVRTKMINDGWKHTHSQNIPSISGGKNVQEAMSKGDLTATLVDFGYGETTIRVSKGNPGQSGQTRNQRRRRSDMTKSREDIVDNLIENSCCWDEADRDELMDLTDNQLNKLDTALEKQLQADAVVNAAREGFGMDSKITVNAMPEFIKKKMAAADEEEEEVVDEEKPTGNVLTREQMEDIALARSIKQERKDVAIGVITGNAQNKFTKEQLNAMPLDTLQNLAALAKPLVNESQNVPSYFGASVPPTANVGTKDDDNDYLPLPTVNWAKPEA